MAIESTGLAASVHHHHLRSGVLRRQRRLGTGGIFQCKARSSLDCDWHRHRCSHGFDNALDQVNVAQQRRACGFATDFFGGTAEVDIDQLDAFIHQTLGRIGHNLGIVPGDLHGLRHDPRNQNATRLTLAGIPQLCLGGDHLAHHMPSTITPR